MLIAKDKRRNNIAEYILYMWQIEDTIRAYKFNIELIDKNIIEQYRQPEEVKNEVRNWYTDLILAMHEEGIMEKGHMKYLNEIMEDLNELHLFLLNKKQDPEYIRIYQFAEANIKDFLQRLKDDNIYSEIEVCFNALYGLLLLKLQKKSISEDTERAMTTFSRLLAQLSYEFRKKEIGED
jgi:hypothetical protein